MGIVVEKDAIYVRNHCARSLARDNEDARNDFGQYDLEDTRSSISEAWRFPIVDSYRNPVDGSGHELNLVTFICPNRAKSLGDMITVIGSFSDLVTPIPLRQVADSDYLGRDLCMGTLYETAELCFHSLHLKIRVSHAAVDQTDA
jgi:hypothetical protein